jgi:hypothetical protein
MIAVHVVRVRKGWHSHAGPGSGPVTFSVAINSTCRSIQPMTLVRFGKINNSVVAKNEPCLTNFRLFEHGLTAFIVIS